MYKAFDSCGHILLKRSTDIKRWLLSAPIQQETGPQRGGIRGWISETGAASFIYPEITGYYLTWLAFMAFDVPQNEPLRVKARDAVSWIINRFKNGEIPATRIYMGSPRSDWRNRLCFSFDLVMMLRGTALAAHLVPASAELHQGIHRLIQQLGRFRHPDGVLKSVIKTSASESPFPAKWSTLAGPFQLKTAAAILSVIGFPIPARLRATAKKTLCFWRTAFDNHPPEGELHPVFYFLEGLLLSGCSKNDGYAWSHAAAVYETVMIHQRKDGGLPASLAKNGSADRSDVVAQALRVGCILKGLGILSGQNWDCRIEGLFNRLCHFITEEGAVAFLPISPKSHMHLNVWCAMFASQALHYYEALSSGHRVDETLVRQWLCLLV